MEQTAIELPRWEAYGNYSSSNYGVNTLRFWLPNGVSVWYSYKTPVAFYSPKTGRVVRQNDWAQTTGKHLNWIDDGAKDHRIPGEAFERQLSELFA